MTRSDAFNYNGDIYKTGRVKVSLDPNPFAAGKTFRQTLDLATGSIRIEAEGVELRIWADALSPVDHVEMTARDDVTVTVAQVGVFRCRRAGCGFRTGPQHLRPCYQPPGQQSTLRIRSSAHSRSLFSITRGGAKRMV